MHYKLLNLWQLFFEVTFQATALCEPYASIGFEVDPFILNTPTDFNVTIVAPRIFFNFNVEVIVLSRAALVNGFIVDPSSWVSTSTTKFSLTGTIAESATSKAGSWMTALLKFCSRFSASFKFMSNSFATVSGVTLGIPSLLFSAAFTPAICPKY